LNGSVYLKIFDGPFGDFYVAPLYKNGWL